MIITLIEYQSPLYFQTHKLREKVLRIPIGLKLRPEDIEIDKKSLIVGAIESDTLIGCLLLLPLDNDVLRVTQVAVDDAHQKTGIGTKMMEFSEGLARDKGFKKIFMNARKSAADFYIKLGYKIDSEEFMHVKVPHFEMIKDL